MAGNIIKICTVNGCPTKCASDQSLPTDVAVATEFARSNGEDVGYYEGRCPQVCEFWSPGSIAVRDIVEPIALCVVAGEPYGMSNREVDIYGHSGVIGANSQGEIILRLLNRKPYPPIA